jgi:hypothetical protein
VVSWVVVLTSAGVYRCCLALDLPWPRAVLMCSEQIRVWVVRSRAWRAHTASASEDPDAVNCHESAGTILLVVALVAVLPRALADAVPRVHMPVVVVRSRWNSS